MRCANCGNELKEGGLYCEACGHPVQIVPDYNEFDDYLDNLVGNDDRSTDEQKTVGSVSDKTIRFDQAAREQFYNTSQPTRQNRDRTSQSEMQQVKQTQERQSQGRQMSEKPQSDRQREKSAQQKRMIIISVVCVISIVILVVIVTNNVRKSHESSFDYQVKQAEEAYESGDTNSAVSYYEKALSIDSDNTDVMYKLADIYMGKKD